MIDRGAGRVGVGGRRLCRARWVLRVAGHVGQIEDRVVAAELVRHVGISIPVVLPSLPVDQVLVAIGAARFQLQRHHELAFAPHHWRGCRGPVVELAHQVHAARVEVIGLHPEIDRRHRTHPVDVGQVPITAIVTSVRSAALPIATLPIEPLRSHWTPFRSGDRRHRRHGGDVFPGASPGQLVKGCSDCGDGRWARHGGDIPGVTTGQTAATSSPLDITRLGEVGVP